MNLEDFILMKQDKTDHVAHEGLAMLRVPQHPSRATGGVRDSSNTFKD